VLFPAVPNLMSATPATSTQTQAPEPAQDPAPPANPPAQTVANGNGDKPEPVLNKKRVHIRHLPYDTNRAQLEELCAPLGRVTNVETKKGYGFVTFESTDDAEFAIYRLNGKSWRDHDLQAEYAKDVSKTAPPPKKFAGEKEKEKRPRREERTLKILTPLNPATQRVGGNPVPKPVSTQVSTPAQTTETTSAGQQGRRGGRGGGARGGARGGRGGRGRGRGGRGGNFGSNSNGGNGNSAPNGSSSSPAAPAPAASSAPVAAQTSPTHPTSASGSRRGGKKNRGGKGGKGGKFFEITVKDVDTGSVTHTLHMTETEVQQFVLPLTEKVVKA